MPATQGSAVLKTGGRFTGVVAAMKSNLLAAGYV